MSNERWAVLSLLVAVRTSMGFQFQSVAAVSPLMTADLGISYAELGILIGAYLLPGVVVALPGGWLAARLGDRRIVLAGLALMAFGGFITGLAGSFGLALVGRLVAGTGAVLLNVVLAKMVTDWFAEGQLVTAMGCLLGAWPLGIALALVSLGGLAEATSWQFVMHVAAALCAAAWLAMRLFYRSAPGEAAMAGAVRRTGLEAAELWPVIAAGTALGDLQRRVHYHSWLRTGVLCGPRLRCGGRGSADERRWLDDHSVFAAGRLPGRTDRHAGRHHGRVLCGASRSDGGTTRGDRPV